MSQHYSSRISFLLQPERVTTKYRTMAAYMRNLSHRSTQRTISSHASQTFSLASRTLALGRPARPRFSENVSYTRSINTTPAYEGHIPLNWFENAFLAVGSAVMSLVDPRRGGAECDLQCPESTLNDCFYRYDRRFRRNNRRSKFITFEGFDAGER